MRSLALALCLGCAAAPLAAQTGRAWGVKDLTFGTLVQGIPLTVLPTDPVGAAQFNIEWRNNRWILLRLTLPPAMAGPAGASLPLAFGGADAGWSRTQSIGSQTAFDPASWYLARLSNRGLGSVFLGGTASPAPAQPPGTYAGVITLTVLFL